MTAVDKVHRHASADSVVALGTADGNSPSMRSMKVVTSEVVQNDKSSGRLHFHHHHLVVSLISFSLSVAVLLAFASLLLLSLALYCFVLLRISSQPMAKQNERKQQQSQDKPHKLSHGATQKRQRLYTHLLIF